MLRLLAIIVVSLLLSPLAMAGPAAKTQSPNAALEEVRQSFTLDGKLIPPEIFRDMGDGDIADGISILVTVDLKAAVGSNRYYEDISKSGKWVVQKKTNKDVANGWEESGYHFIGSTSNKLLVVVTSYNGGGSGTFYTLHILDLAAGKAFDQDGHAYDRINLTTVRAVPLGDRWDGSVKISGNSIEVQTTKGGASDTRGEASTSKIEARRP